MDQGKMYQIMIMGILNIESNTKHLEDNFNNIINDINKDFTCPTFDEVSSTTNNKKIISNEINQKYDESNYLTCKFKMSKNNSSAILKKVSHQNK